ncbi:MAG: S9 family peptidase [Cytophagales bacterium]|nr:S9 family peptidase [Cytophagales bacterium]
MIKKFILCILFLVPLGSFGQNTLTPELLWKLGRVGGGEASPDGKSVLYTVRTYDLGQNTGSNQLYTIPADGGQPVLISSANHSPYEAHWRPDGLKVTFLQKGQLFEMNPDGSGLAQVSDTKKPILTYRYSPDLRFVAYAQSVKLKQTTQELYPAYGKAEALIIDDLMYRHWDHWNDTEYNHLMYAPLQNGRLLSQQAVDLMKGEKFDCPTVPFGGREDFTISRDGKQIVYSCKKLEGKEYAVSTNTDLYAYSTADNTTVNLTEGMMGYDSHPSFSPDGKHLAWLSMKRGGYEADKYVLYSLELSSNTKTPLTNDFDETISTFEWMKNGKGFYFLTGAEATYQLFEAKFSKRKKTFDNENIRQITAGVHNYKSISQAGKKLIALKQSMSSANEIFSVNIKKGTEKQLTFVNKPIYDKLKMGKVEKRWIKTTDGKNMLTWVIYPPNFDPNKKYPTLLYCQGGPQSAVSQFFSFRWNFQLMAAKGYIVVAPNRRGLPSFGTQWNEAISKDWGGQPMKDYLSAIDEMAKEPFVDENRLGAIGASYGGYSVYYLAGIHENRFKTFVSHCGLFDLRSWYGTTEELFFANWDIGGPYWKKSMQEAYKKFSPSSLVANWNTPMLVIHGGKDFRVPETQGMQAFQALQLKNIKSRFLYFPNEGHWVLKPQNGIIWHTEFFKWLKETL